MHEINPFLLFSFSIYHNVYNAGRGDGKKSWLVHLSGGGWCWDMEVCYLRSFTELGSSSSKYLSPTFNLTGVHSDNPGVNPDFYNWNVAMVNYCDGASFSGNVVGIILPGGVCNSLDTT